MILDRYIICKVITKGELMKTYYEWLEIQPTSSKEEIKKAYFRMVRKYPPDKEEEKFKSIREAYETLSNAKTKQEYDQMLMLPEDIKVMIDKGKQLLSEGYIQQSVVYFEFIIDRCPNIEFLKAELAHVYILNGNTGKAIKMLEDLIAKYPKIPGYRTKLGIAYLERGWNNKALSQLEDAIKLDEDNIGGWLALIKVYKNRNKIQESIDVINRALKKESLQEVDFVLYYELLLGYLMLGVLENNMAEYHQEIKGALRNIQVLGRNDKEKRKSCGIMMLHVIDFMAEYDEFTYLDVVVEIAEELIEKNEETVELIKCLKKYGKYAVLIGNMVKEGALSEKILQLLLFEMHGDKAEEHEMMVEAVEIHVAENYREFREEIQQLKEVYPGLYMIKKEFFGMLENTKERRKFVRNSSKRAMEMMAKVLEKMGSEGFGYEEEEEWEEDYNRTSELPFVRIEVKVGRNEPCPCGSGKKYKKCCKK